MKGGALNNSQKATFNSLKVNRVNQSVNIDVYVCNSLMIGIQLDMIQSNHRNASGRLNSQNVTPKNNLIYVGKLTSLKEIPNGNKIYYSVTTDLHGEEKRLLVTNKDNFYANFGTNVLVIDIAAPNSVKNIVKRTIGQLCVNAKNTE